LAIDDLVDTKALTQLVLETFILNGIPAVFTIVVIFFAAKSFKNKDKRGMNGPNAVNNLYEDLYGNGDNATPTSPFSIRPPKANEPINLGIPQKNYLKITKLNDVYDSYAFSLTAATQSKARAAAKLRSKKFDMALTRAFDSSVYEFTNTEKAALLKEEEQFLKEGGTYMAAIIQMQKVLTDLTIRKEMKKMNVKVGEVDVASDVIANSTATETKEDKESGNFLTKMKDGRNENKLMDELEDANTELMRLELSFIRTGAYLNHLVRSYFDSANSTSLIGHFNFVFILWLSKHHISFLTNNYDDTSCENYGTGTG